MWRAAWLLLLASAARAALDVTVVQMQLEFDVVHHFSINSSVEYILQFTPSSSDATFPSRVWARVSGGDTARPVLLTRRQGAGAGSWQLPYLVQQRTLAELERTLCPDDAAKRNDGQCAETARGAFSLHASSGCERAATLELRATTARDWQLAPPLDGAESAPTHADITLTAPRVFHYSFDAGPESVRLVFSSEDDVCALLTVQNYTCPIAETLEDVQGTARRMTVQRSGAVQLARGDYPLGFYVVALMQATDAACSGEEDADDDWLFLAALGAEARQEHLRARRKAFTLTVQPALTRGQYMLASGVTLAALAALYVAAGALVLAQRWPRLARFVRPRAVLAPPPTHVDNAAGAETGVDGVPREGRRRRDSTATFDSSDLSDSDDEDIPTRDTSVPASPSSPATSPTTPVASPTTPVASPTTPVASPTTPVASPADSSAPEPPLASSATAADDPRQVTAVDGSQPADASHPDGVQTNDQQARPFGLPARLHLAAMARHRGRVLRARSDRYLYTLYTVAVFYFLPVVQFVAAFQLFLNVSGSLDTCYYNFLCAHPAGALSDFNHVFSNVGYLLLGTLFLLQVRRRRARRRRRPRHEDYGIPAHYGLLQALGASMMVVGLLSASYHVCPNRLNFQFDTAFMYVLAVLSMVKIYQSRHPDVNARAHATFGVLAVLIALVVWGVLGGGAVFWALFTVLHIFGFLLLSLRIYYVGQFRLEKQTLQLATRGLRALPAEGLRPLYTARLLMLVIANAANGAFAVYGLYMQSADFAGHMLSVLLGNTLLHMVFYIVMKLLNGERPRWYVWVFLAGATAAWTPGLYFFLSGSTDWSATPALSRHLNHECLVLRFYDSHDLWHFLSAIALYLTFNVFLTWDDGLAAVKRTEIAVF